MSAAQDPTERPLPRHLAEKVSDALRNVWRGSDRGELRALLVEAWGPSPAKSLTPGEMGHAADIAERLRVKVDGIERGASDLRGLAARESAGPCLDPDKMHGAADGFGGSDY